jgi:hypothetical protein
VSGVRNVGTIPIYEPFLRSLPKERPQIRRNVGTPDIYRGFQGGQVKPAGTLAIEHVSIDDLRPDPANPPAAGDSTNASSPVSNRWQPSADGQRTPGGPSVFLRPFDLPNRCGPRFFCVQDHGFLVAMRFLNDDR